MNARSLSAYVHVPYCLRRCGYCDFNTYANLLLEPGASHYADALISEINLTFGARGDDDTGFAPSRQYRENQGSRQLYSVFFGGGTPTVLPAADLGRILAALDESYGLAPGAEVTVEANPDTVDAHYLRQLAAAGVTRVSLGMQSARAHVLKTLDRTHTQANLAAAVLAARETGLDVSVDLIYGTPGETVADWKASLEAALDLGVTHISCYALTVEPGTALGRKVVHGEIPNVDPDDQADKYELADKVLSAAGLAWYELSNWAATGYECQHNLAYWHNQDWLGFGPGAHSHWGNTRYWNEKSPVKWSYALAAGQLGIAGGERLSRVAMRLEAIMLGLRTREGLDLQGSWLQGANTAQRKSLSALINTLRAEGLLHEAHAETGRAVLTLSGRLLADLVTRRIYQALGD